MGTACHRYSAINVLFSVVLCSGFASRQKLGSLPNQDFFLTLFENWYLTRINAKITCKTVYTVYKYTLPFKNFHENIHEISCKMNRKSSQDNVDKVINNDF